MADEQTSSKGPGKLPITHQGIYAALRHDMGNPDFIKRMFKEIVERDQVFAQNAVISSHVQYPHDPEKAESFVNGVIFAIGALEREITTQELRKLARGENIIFKSISVKK